MKMNKTYALFAIVALTVGLMLSCSSHENASPVGLGLANFHVNVAEIDGLPTHGDFKLTLMTADSAYSKTWTSLDDINALEPYQTGAYSVSASYGDAKSEGYGCQAYAGTTLFEITDAVNADINIECTLAQAMIQASIEPTSAAPYRIAGVQFHTKGHRYLAVEPGQPSPLLIAPGETVCFVDISNGDGSTIRIKPNLTISTEAATLYKAKASISAANMLTIECNAAKDEMVIDQGLFDGEGPSIATEGFTSGEVLSLREGYGIAAPVAITARASAGLKALSLTSIASQGVLNSIPGDINLLDAAPSILPQGIEVTRNEDGSAKVDFTRLLEGLTVSGNSEVSFIMQARDMLDRISAECLLNVEIRSLDFSIESIEGAVIGQNVASVTLALNTDEAEAQDFSIMLEDDEHMSETEITRAEIDKAAKTLRLWFRVPEGIDEQKCCIYYMGLPKSSFIAPRIAPEYAISVDAFASSAIVTIIAPDPAIRSAVTKYASVFANGKETAVDTRVPHKGIIHAIGLQPSTAYTFAVRIFDGDNAPEAKISTEAAASLPDGDFEDATEAYNYKHIPSGGIFSNTIFPIYNMQNYIDFLVYWPNKHWASVNAKTLCRTTSNNNSWYIQPSSMLDYESYVSGSKSVRLTSTGWSLSGGEIPPYVQTPEGYLPYNANVPAQDHAAAGKLFLGSYKFDAATMAETYEEGIKFTSRPSSLNGFYKYIPDKTNMTDAGIVTIEIINDENGLRTVLAKASMPLRSSPDFVTFNLPIKYDVLGVKATRLCLMFATSDKIGSIADEDANVPVTPDASAARYSGSTLWIDNLSFSYSY